MTKFVTNASSVTWWLKLEPMLIALHVGQISFSQDYFKLLSVRKLIQVEMLYPGFVVPLAMFFGHVMSSHHSEQMSQRSQVSRIALGRCSQNVFVFVFVIVFVFVFVFVNVFLVMSCLLITLNKCLKGNKSLGLLWVGVLKMSLSLSLSFFLVRSCLFITLIKCLKGPRSLGSLCNVKSKSTVS